MTHGRTTQNDIAQVLNEKNTVASAFGVEQEVPFYGTRNASGTFVPWTLDKGAPRKMVLVTSGHESLKWQIVRNGYDSTDWVTAESGVYLKGGKLYKDVQCLEICTPECRDPYELAFRIEELRNAFRHAPDVQNLKFRIFINSMDREGAGSFHENYFQPYEYSHHEAQIFAEELVPALVSRCVLTGAGGADLSDRLCLSPRIFSMEKVFSSTSQRDRGYVLDREEHHVDFGRRLQLMSSDQLLAPETVALQFGLTAFAVRLGELGFLPETKINWFAKSYRLIYQDIGATNEMFVAAVSYQRELLERARMYDNACKEKGLPRLLASDDATMRLFDTWERKLQLLSAYIDDHDLEAIADEFEWAQKYRFIEKRRARKNQPMDVKLSSAEVWACMELTAFVPSFPAFAQCQEPFLDFDYEDRGFSIPRAQARVTFIDAFHKQAEEGKIPGTPFADWRGVRLFHGKCTESVTLPRLDSHPVDEILSLVDTFPNQHTHRGFCEPSKNHRVGSGPVVSRSTLRR
jgi:hypothetical protein